MTVQMLVVQGKQRGKLMLFPLGDFVFGRGPECHVRPESEQISRQHCILSVAKTDVQIRDLGSTNGTLINGRRVVGQQVLHDGDHLQLGPVVLRIKIIPESSVETISDVAVKLESDTL